MRCVFLLHSPGSDWPQSSEAARQERVEGGRGRTRGSSRMEERRSKGLHSDVPEEAVDVDVEVHNFFCGTSCGCGCESPQLGARRCCCCRCCLPSAASVVTTQLSPAQQVRRHAAAHEGG